VPREEIAGIDRLERIASSGVVGRAPTMSIMARVRRVVLARAIQTCLTTHSGRSFNVASLASRVRATQSQLSVWLTESGLSQPSVKRLEALLRERSADLSALELFEAQWRNEPDFEMQYRADALTVIGQGASIAMPDAVWWIDRTAASVGMPRLRADGFSQYTLVGRSRRVPGKHPHAPYSPGRGPAPDVALDRVDTLAELILACPRLDRARTLLSAGQALLGKVVRDVPLLLALLQDLPARESTARRALVIGLGLLGAAPALDVAFVDRNDPAEAAAIALGIVLARSGDDEPVVAQLRALDRAALGTARQATQTARRRVESGQWLTVVE
jgi:hypothetical protein